jgi:hypothetical protein
MPVEAKSMFKSGAGDKNLIPEQRQPHAEIGILTTLRA